MLDLADLVEIQCVSGAGGSSTGFVGCSSGSPAGAVDRRATRWGLRSGGKGVGFISQEAG